MSHIVLETRDLTVRFGGHIAVDAVSCAFAAGQTTAIVGPNGAGKTTFFNAISGQVPISNGWVFLAGENVSRWPVSARTRKGVGRAFQQTNLFPGLSVRENIRLAIQARRRAGFQMLRLAGHNRKIRSETDDLLDRVRLGDKAGHLITELSHGDQRKIEVALLMALRPRVYMFDEPTAGMSVDEAPVILELIADLKQDNNACVMLVEHKMDVLRALADRIVVLHNGALAADGEPAVVMQSDVVQEAYMGRGLENV